MVVPWEYRGIKYLKGKHSNNVYQFHCPEGSDERHVVGIWQADSNTMEWVPEFDPASQTAETSVFTNIFGLFDVSAAPGSSEAGPAIARTTEDPYATPHKGNTGFTDDASVGDSSWKVRQSNITPHTILQNLLEKIEYCLIAASCPHPKLRWR